jgi:muramoyltetrapeptide carboxypeptidase
MIKKSWSFLNSGDIVDIIAPSFTVPADNLSQYYQKAKQTLDQIGVVARIPDDLIVLGRDPFAANSLEYRKNHLIEVLNNTDSKAIWAIRGGYGAAQIIPFLENIAEPKLTKLLLGFSDITALHLFIEKKWQWPSMHSAVINQLVNNSNLLQELKPILFGEKLDITYDQLLPLNLAAQENKVIEAEITGGNLSIVQTSLATSWQINAKDKIVFLEDVGEIGYRIHRMLNQLTQAGIFKEAKAIIFGEITPGLEKDGGDKCPLAVEDFIKNINNTIPILSLPIIGHNTQCNSPLPLNTKCKLTLGNKPLLSCESGGK